MRSLSLLLLLLIWCLSLSAQIGFRFDFKQSPDSMNYEELQSKIEEVYNLPIVKPDTFYQRLLPYGEKLIELSKQKHGPLDLKFGHDLNYVSQLFQMTSDYRRSNEILEVVLQIVAHNENEEHIDYARILIAISMNHFLLSEIKQAIDCFLPAESILPQLLRPSEVDYQTQLYSVATLYEVFGRYEKASLYFRKFATYSKEILGNNNLLYAEGLLALGNVQIQAGQLEAAKIVLDSSLQIKEKLLGKENDSYLKTLNSISNYFTQTYQYDTSIVILKQIVDLRSKRKPSLAYATSLQNLAVTYFEDSQYELAFPLMEEAVELKKVLVTPSHYEYLNTVSNYLGMLGKGGEFEKALPHLEYLQTYVDTTSLRKHPIWIRVANNLGHFYGLAGQPDEALAILIEAEEVIIQIAGKKHISYARSQNNLAEIYSQLGDWKKAEKYYHIAKSIWETELGPSTFEFASVLGNVATIHSYRGNFKEAIVSLKESSSLHAKCKGKNNLSYIEQLNNLALAYQKDRQNKKARQTFYHALSLADSTFSQDHPIFFLLYTNIGRLHEEHDELDTAVQFYIKADQLGKRVFPPAHPEYTVNLLGLGSVYEKLGKLSLAQKYYEVLLQAYLIQFKSYYPVLSEQGKLLYHHKEKSKIDMVLSFFHRHPSNNVQIHNALLTFSIQMKELGLAHRLERTITLASTKDEILRRYYDAWKLMRSQLTEAFINPKLLTKSTQEKLQHDIEQLETKMGIRSKAIAPNFGNWKQGFKTEKEFGSPDQERAYVDFYHFRYYDGLIQTDSILYYATVVQSNHAATKPIFICEEKQILEIIGNTSNFYLKYTQDGYDLKELILDRILPFFSDIKQIEISPSGQINRIAFSGLPLDKKGLSYLADQYQVCYRGSFRQTIHSANTEIESQNALLVGDIDYGLGDSTSAQVIPLHATEKEVHDIATILDSLGKRLTIFKGPEATEQAIVRALEQKPYIIQHYATHGYFLKGKKDQKAPLQLPYESRLTKINNPLFRSGLILGKVNDIWLDKDHIHTSNDGILTAYEIANLRIPKSSLIVLSGCVTGLGDIHAAEGILGLRYAFKAAGARALILSLWEVDDQTTAEFMGLLYKSFQQCQDAQTALAEAVAAMRSKYDSAKYWAGFVLYQ